MTRDTRLRKWVRQPPTTPIIQSLRDEERRRALGHLDSGGCVLDIASESNVTTDIEAKSLTRVDFSPDANEYAQEIIGNGVERYQRTTPESPGLPFKDDMFDAAISIGPYDWKFLDIETLTAELHRVLDSDGQFIFSVPTPRSPYAESGGNENRYYEPTEALSLLSSG